MSKVLCVALAAMTGATAMEKPAEPTLVSESKPVQLCLAPDQSGLGDSRRRAVLALHALDPADNGPPRISVAADTGETTQIGLFPGGPARPGGETEARRFFLPGDTATRCWDISLVGEGTAAITLELSEPLE